MLRIETTILILKEVPVIQYIMDGVSIAECV